MSIFQTFHAVHNSRPLTFFLRSGTLCRSGRISFGSWSDWRLRNLLRYLAGWRMALPWQFLLDSLYVKSSQTGWCFFCQVNVYLLQRSMCVPENYTSKIFNMNHMALSSVFPVSAMQPMDPMAAIGDSCDKTPNFQRWHSKGDIGCAKARYLGGWFSMSTILSFGSTARSSRWTRQWCGLRAWEKLSIDSHLPDVAVRCFSSFCWVTGSCWFVVAVIAE